MYTWAKMKIQAAELSVRMKALLAVFAGGACNVALDLLSNELTHRSAMMSDWRALLRAAVVGGGIALIAYLKQSPLPKKPEPDTSQIRNTTE